MTDKDRDNYIKVLLALSGKDENGEDKNSKNSSTKSSTDFEKASIYGGYGLRS